MYHLLCCISVVHQMQIFHPLDSFLSLLGVLPFSNQSLFQGSLGHRGSRYDAHRPHFRGHFSGGIQQFGMLLIAEFFAGIQAKVLHRLSVQCQSGIILKGDPITACPIRCGL